MPLCTHSQTQNGAVQEFKEDLEKRATRLARRLDEEQASHDREREAHASELLSVKAQVDLIRAMLMLLPFRRY